jgi:hypothetical protein
MIDPKAKRRAKREAARPSLDRKHDVTAKTAKYRSR